MGRGHHGRLLRRQVGGERLVELRGIDRELGGGSRAVRSRVLQRELRRPQDAVAGAGGHLAEALALVRGERGDEDEPADVAETGCRVGDHRAAVGMADGEDRPGDLPHEAGDVGGVVGDAAQRIRRRGHLDTRALEALDDAVPARRVGEGAVDEHDGDRGVGGCF